MPIYEYIDSEKCRTVEMYRPVAERDQVPAHFKRVTVPERVRLCGFAQEECAETEAKRGLRECELAIGTGALEREIGLPARKIKEIWDAPE